MNRRELFRIVGAGVALTPGLDAQDVQHVHGMPETLSDETALHKSYRPRFFTEEEYRTLDEMCEVLLPADGDSPGARDAGVAFFLDTVILYAPEEVKREWKAGMRQVDELSQQLNAKTFSSATSSEREAIFDRFAADESDVRTVEPAFFSTFKRRAIEGFCYSEVGMRDYLRYRGETAISSFPGCPGADRPKV
jgi:hypothetical protein